MLLPQPPQWRSRGVVDHMTQAVTSAVLVPDRVALGQVLDPYYSVGHIC
jgi:hypothetical protein